jgi:hypothetical protein
VCACCRQGASAIGSTAITRTNTPVFYDYLFFNNVIVANQNGTTFSKNARLCSASCMCVCMWPHTFGCTIQPSPIVISPTSVASYLRVNNCCTLHISKPTWQTTAVGLIFRTLTNNQWAHCYDCRHLNNELERVQCTYVGGTVACAEGSAVICILVLFCN